MTSGVGVKFVGMSIASAHSITQCRVWATESVPVGCLICITQLYSTGVMYSSRIAGILDQYRYPDDLFPTPRSDPEGHFFALKISSCFSSRPAEAWCPFARQIKRKCHPEVSACRLWAGF